MLPKARGIVGVWSKTRRVKREARMVKKTETRPQRHTRWGGRNIVRHLGSWIVQRYHNMNTRQTWIAVVSAHNKQPTQYGRNPHTFMPVGPTPNMLISIWFWLSFIWMLSQQSNTCWLVWCLWKVNYVCKQVKWQVSMTGWPLYAQFPAQTVLFAVNYCRSLFL